MIILPFQKESAVPRLSLQPAAIRFQVTKAFKTMASFQLS